MTNLEDSSNEERRGARSRLVAGLRFLQSAIFLRSHNRAWVNEIRGVIAELEKLNQTTEADFLAVGGNLMAFLTDSRQLHSDIGGLTALVSGEQARHACNALVSVRGYVQERQHRCEEDGRSLLALQASGGRIRRGFSTLGKIALSFRITAILARIETAHLAASGQELGTLADEVRSCGDGIQSRAGQVVETAVAFDSQIASTLREVSRLDELQQKELPSLLAEVDSDLAVFEVRQREAASASTKLTADLSSVAEDLGAIATSIQFHDITRQQVEHVIEALTGLLGDTPRGALSPSNAALVRVQNAQLRSAAAAFSQSTQRIDRDLYNIAARVAEMAAASKGILGLDHNQKDTFLNDMQRRFTNVLRIVGESRTLERAAGAIIADIEGLRRRLRTSVNEIQAIELQLNRISINAAISASHIGVAGEPLNVVAAAMQRLQFECASHSREAEGDLDSIRTAILSLSAGDAGNADDASGVTLLDDLNARIDGLRSASVASAEAAGAVATLADTLCGNLHEARKHSGIGQLFVETVNHCGDALDDLAAQAQPLWSSYAPAAKEALDERYTMQAERDVHQAVVTDRSSLPKAAPDSAEYGQEVEFF